MPTKTSTLKAIAEGQYVPEDMPTDVLSAVCNNIGISRARYDSREDMIKLIHELVQKEFPNTDIQHIELSERDRSLIGWALRSKILEPRFHNEGMKNEICNLADLKRRYHRRAKWLQ